jgi:hypothetical protein
MAVMKPSRSAPGHFAPGNRLPDAVSPVGNLSVSLVAIQFVSIREIRGLQKEEFVRECREWARTLGYPD